MKIELELELVETLIHPKTSYYGSVMLLELKDAMESRLKKVLLRGGKISISEAFNYVWNELIVTDTELSSSYDDKEDDM
jgi:hypothetical protein